MKKVFVFAALIVALIACNQPAVDTKAEGKKLMELSREWSKLLSTKDVDKIVSYWADDAILYSAGEAPLKGKAAIRQMVEGSFNAPGFQISWEPKEVEISKSGDMGYLLEESQITVVDSTGKPSTQYFNSVTVWKNRQTGNWKNVVDVMNPAAAR